MKKFTRQISFYILGLVAFSTSYFAVHFAMSHLDRRYAISMFDPVHICDHIRGEDYSQIKIPIHFMPGKPKCITYLPKGAPKEETYGFYRDLREFVIKKNDKHCLWGSDSWDAECENASLEYAYGDYGQPYLYYGKYYPNEPEDYKKFKYIVVDFIRYIQYGDINNALKLLTESARFYTNDDANCISKHPHTTRDDRPGCYDTFNTTYHSGIYSDKFSMEAFIENINQINLDNLSFYLDDVDRIQAYGIVVPYQHNGIQKLFSVVFDYAFAITDQNLPRDFASGLKIRSLGIHNQEIGTSILHLP